MKTKQLIYILIIAIILFGIAVGLTALQGPTQEPITENENGEFPQEVTLRPGDGVVMNGLSLVFNEMVQDYRCPVDTECIEAGGVVVSVTLNANGTEETVNVASDEVAHAFENYWISIVDVEPEMRSNIRINTDEYQVTFLVEERAENEITWAEAVGIIRSGEIESVFQTHDRRVEIVLADGTTVTTVEPTLDAVFEELQACGDRCSHVTVATE